MSLKVTERQIEKAILQWLRLKNIFAWKVKTVGIFDPTTKTYRRPPKDYLRGVSDIIGIYRGRPLAIEVKSDSGDLTKDQAEFLIRFQHEGGIGVVARSIEDVERALRQHEMGVKGGSESA